MAKTAEFVTIRLDGVSSEELKNTLTQVCGHHGLHTPFGDSDGYTNGGEITLFPIISGEESGVRLDTNVAVLVSHRYHQQLADNGTPRFIDLIAPAAIVDNVKSLIATGITPIAIPQPQP